MGLDAYMRALITLSAILLTFTISFASAQGTEQIVVKNGQQKVTKTGRLTVKFVELLEDSRCPANVTCVWAGIARVKLRLTKNGKTADVELNTTNNKSTIFQGHSISLEGLQPRQTTTSKYSPSAYSATLSVARKK